MNHRRGGLCHLGILFFTLALHATGAAAQSSNPAGSLASPPADSVKIASPAKEGNAAGNSVSAPAEKLLPPAPILGNEKVQVVYVVPMRNHMNTYLARELTIWGRIKVTLNPKDADAFLTDDPQINISALLSEKTDSFHTVVSKPGNMFMISTKSQKILWATGKPLTSRNPLAGPKTLESLAKDLVDQLKHEINSAEKKQQKEEASKE